MTLVEMANIRQLFLRTMQEIHGPFEGLSLEEAENWVPPPMTAGHQGRYLWTDAFSVVNFLTIYKETSDARYLALARCLIQAVHDTLGRTRDGTRRLGAATDESPLLGGLRIGQEEDSGSDGDGQYHHYLTIWMFALNRMSIASGERWYNNQAISLLKAIHPKFMVNRHSNRPHMHWKMSVDLSEVLVSSEGNLDPINGYVICKVLQSLDDDPTSIQQEISEYKKILDAKWQGYASYDPLDLGMTFWITQLLKEEWSTFITRRAFYYLRQLAGNQYFYCLAISHRVAFREFGTCLGIGCHDAPDDLQTLRTYILSLWSDALWASPPRQVTLPEKFRPITLVMYASAMIPGAFRSGYLESNG